MSVNRWIQLACVLVSVVCVAMAASLAPRIDQQRKDLQLTFTIEDGKNMPPAEAAVTMALGSFRGLFADMLWYRATQLHQAGRHHEADILARWITTLQPRFGQVWVFQGWNMAYNISVTKQTPEERWEWVNKGIRLVRDKGIPYNESNVLLYKELAWWYFHKIGQYSDDMHWYYKTKFAEEWQIVLGDSAQGATTQQTLDAFRRIVDAPDTVAELMAQDREVAALVDRLAQMGWVLDRHGRFTLEDKENNIRFDDDNQGKLLRQMGRIMLYLGSVMNDVVVRQGLVDHLRRQEVDVRLIDLLTDESLRPAIDKLLLTLRKRELIDYYNMRPDYMMMVMEGRAGGMENPVPLPLDWRHPAAHAIYWSQLGVEKSIYLLNKKNVDKLNTYRQYIHSVQALVYSGRVQYDPLLRRDQDGEFGRVDQFPDVRFFDAYDQAVEAGREYVINNAELFNDPTVDSFDMGHENLLIKAVVFSYLYGYRDKAEQFYEKVRRLYSHKPDNRESGRYYMPLETFVEVEAPQAWDEYVGKVQFVDAMLIHAFRDGLGRNDLETYSRFRRVAARAFAEFQQTGTTIATAPQERLALGMGDDTRIAFVEKEIRVFANYMVYQGHDLYARSVAWRNAPDLLRKGAYDLVRGQLVAQCQMMNAPFATLFPEPPGMEEFRRSRLATPDQTPSGEVPRVERR